MEYLELKRVWVTWETQRRNRELSRSFSCKFYELDESRYCAVARYILSTYKTVRLLINERPDVVFVQCPSVMLVFVVSVLQWLFGYRIVIDAHNSGVEWAKRTRHIIGHLIRLAFRNADAVIVSNSYLSAQVSAYCRHTLILPDRLPEMEIADVNLKPDSIPRVVLICSYAKDEPIEKFIQGISQVEYPFQLLVTGKKSKAGALLRYESEKIRFTDYIPDTEYKQLIACCSLVVDLTTRENCLVCGAYEGLSAGRPLLLSDTLINREIFIQGCLFARNEPSSYADALRQFFSQQSRLETDILVMRNNYEKYWQSNNRFAEQFLMSLHSPKRLANVSLPRI